MTIPPTARTQAPDPVATLGDLVRLGAERWPEAAAIVAPGRPVLTYEALRAEVETIAVALAGLGLGSGDRVAVSLPQGPEMAVAIVGVAASATCVPLNPNWRVGEYEAYLAETGTRAVVLRPGAAGPLIQAARALDLIVLGVEVPPAQTAAGVMKLDPIEGSARDADEPRGGEGAEATALVLPTSGTTSRPKRVPLRHANLIVSAHSIAASLALSPRDRGLVVMPLFHIHGLMMTLATLASGGAVACCPGAFDPSLLAGWLAELAPTWYSAVPTIHHAVVSHAGLVRGAPELRSVRFVRSASAPLPARLGAGLEQLFDAPVIEAYGMTEAAHQIASNPLPPGERRSGSVGRSAGAEMMIVDEAGLPLPSGETGEVAVRGGGVTDGYEGGVDAGFLPGGWLRTGDLGRLDRDGYLYLTGRIKELVNRGGQKIAPQEIEEVLGSHPAVAEVAAFPIPHLTLGEDVGAAVVLRDGATVTPEALRVFARERLADYRVPARVRIVERLPLGPAGKLQRARLSELLEPAMESAAAPAETSAEAAVIRVWRDVLGRDIGRDGDFFALGGDSLTAIRMLQALERESGVLLPVAAIFQAPTVKGIAAAVTLAAEGGSAAAERAAGWRIPRRDSTRPGQLSLAQQRLWFLEQLSPGSAVYNEPVAFRLTGSLDEGALGRSLDEIVARHEALRTAFVMEGSAPGELVQKARPVPLELLDLSGLGTAAQAAALAQALHDTATSPFDLASDLLLRARLVRLGDGDHMLTLVTHHIASDGWSWGVLYRELGALYRAHLRGKAAPLPPLSIQYGDFASWQRQWLERGDLERQLEYWRRQLAGAPTQLDLPADRPRPEAPSHAGGRVVRTMPASLAAELQALAQGEGATLFMALLAGFFALLHRYTGREDVMVATPTAGRTRVETEPLIGFFVGTLALRGDLRDDPTARVLLRRARKVALDAYAHQDVPFERLVAELAPERSLARNPLVQVLLALDPDRGLPELPGLVVTPVPIATDRAKLDLSVHVAARAGELEVTAIHSTELFDSQTIGRLLEHFEILLRSMVEAPETPLSALPMLPSHERHRLLVEWNDTARAHAGPVTIHGLVAAQVARTPGAAALVWRGRETSYADLDAAANRLAWHLRALGAAPERTVAVCARRSPALVTALLAVLKTGGAYVPLDPTWPDERIRLLLEDSGAGLVLTEADLVGRLGDGAWKAVCLDRDAGEWEERPASPLEEGSGAESLAYIAYTSGSTGRPKGILCAHGGAVNYLRFVLETYSFGPSDVILPRSPVAFDATVREIFGTLAAGARMILLDDDEVRDPSTLLETVRTCGVTVLTLVPTLLRAVCSVAEEGAGPAPSLRLLLLSGEPLFSADVRRARSTLAPRAEVINQYGPSECTIISAYHRADPDADVRAGVPIGRPVWNARLYVLDGSGEPMPIGVPGELYIGGAGVARGYLGPAALTAERFLPDPFDARPGARMYRTGDVVRRLADGTLEILGRTDNQVKVRGNRVELEEIEAVIRRHAGVREVAVALWPPEAVEPDLVAYVVAESSGGVRAADVRAHVRAHLPRYMEPHRVELLDALPLTPIGKVDRRALPAPRSVEAADGAYVEPRSPLEWQIASIWKALLGVPRVGATDDFFALGGHSLLAVRMMQAVERECGRRLALTALFSASTVEGLAAELLRQESVRFRAPLTLLRAEGSRPPFFFLHGDYNGGGFYSRALAAGLDEDQPFYAVHPHPLIERPIPRSVAAMASELVVDVRAVQPHGPYRLGGHCNGALLAFEMARQLRAAGERVEALVLIDVSARNARFRLLGRLARAAAMLRGIDHLGEADLFVRLRDLVTEFVRRAGRRLRGVLGRPRDTDVRRRPADGEEDHDLAPPTAAWPEGPRVAEYRRLVRAYVPGRYAGQVTLLVPQERPRPVPDLEWSRVAARVEVHTVPGAHLTAITLHSAAVAERLRDCLRRASAAGG